MVVVYTIAGRKVGSHILSIATIGTVIGIATLAMPSKKNKSTPPIQADSSEEEKFIKDFLAKAEAESAKAKH